MLEILKRITLSDIGNVASILGLLITILVLINLRNIKRFYVFTARVPELLEKLGKHAGKISVFQKDFSNSGREIELELAEAEIVLKSLRTKLNRQAKSSAKRVLNTVKRYNRTNPNQESLWTVYVEIQKLISEVQELQSDLKWRK